MIFAQVAFITDWFVGKNLNFALGIANSVPLFGEVCNAFLSPYLYQKNYDKITCTECFKGYGWTFYLGMVICAVCFLIVIIVIIIDYKA